MKLAVLGENTIMFPPTGSDSSSSINVLSMFVTVVLAVSIADERVIELLKGWLPTLPIFTTKTDGTKEARRNANIHFLSAVVGTLIAWSGKVDLFKDLPQTVWPAAGGTIPSWHSGYWATSWIATGLLASAGSAFWNHTLDILKASKVKQEQTAIASFAANRQRGLVDTGHPSAYTLAALVSTAATSASSTVCRIGPGTPPADFAASTGIIDLMLVVTRENFAFVPIGCSVTGPGSANVPFDSASSTELKFNAGMPGTYTLSVQYACTSGSIAQLKENCTSSLILRRLDGTVNPHSTYTFNIF